MENALKTVDKMDYLCRICHENEGTLYLFNEELEISAKIMYCCPKVTICKGDGLPDKICSFCFEDLLNAYQFVRKCERTDNELRTLEHAEIKFEPEKMETELKTEVKSEDIADPEPDTQNNESDSDSLSDYNPAPIKRPRKKYKNKTYVFTCKVCGKVCQSKGALNVHSRKHTETPYHCRFCEKKFKDVGELMNHLRADHGDRNKNFICELCGKAFLSKKAVRIHLRTHTGERPFSCPECAMTFTQLSAMQRHKRRHTGIKPFSCPTCSKSFFVKDALKEHQKVHTKEPKKCKECKTVFRNKTSLEKHSHTDKKTFICNYCGRLVKTKSNLEIHINKMHSEKSGTCNICAKHVPNLEVHMWKHTGEKPLKCELCPSSFSDKRGLAQHVYYRHKEHEKNKCTFPGCTMSFPYSHRLAFHYKKVHGNKLTFPCDQCAEEFTRKNDLVKHKFGIHQGQL